MMAETNNTFMNLTIFGEDQMAHPIEIITRSISCLTFTFGFPTHCYVIWLIFKSTNAIATEFFNLNLFICEIGVCLNSLLVTLSLQCSSCNILSNVFFGICITGRPLFQCLMCVERYLAVVHPVTFLRYKPLRYRVFSCSVAWIITLGSCFVYVKLITFSNLMKNTFYFMTQFIVFLFAQLFCLVAVLRGLKQSGPGETRKDSDNQMKRRAFNLILIITLSMAITYAPCILYAFIVIFTGQEIAAILLISLLCYNFAAFVQPVLFLKHAGKLPLF